MKLELMADYMMAGLEAGLSNSGSVESTIVSFTEVFIDDYIIWLSDKGIKMTSINSFQYKISPYMCYNLLKREDLFAGGLMIQTIADFIVEIFKKYGMETLISFVLAIITITLIPITWIDILPFEKQNIYWALLFAVACWIIIVDALRRFIGTIGSKTSNISYNKRRADRQTQEMLHKFWNEVDQLSERDRKYLMQFINNENTPISCMECNQEYGGLFHSNWVDKTEKRTKIQIELIDYKTREKSIGLRYDTHIFKLKDEIYEILKFTYKKHGRIGNFKEDYS